MTFGGFDMSSANADKNAMRRKVFEEAEKKVKTSKNPAWKIMAEHRLFDHFTFGLKVDAVIPERPTRNDGTWSAVICLIDWFELSKTPQGILTTTGMIFETLVPHQKFSVENFCNTFTFRCRIETAEKYYKKGDSFTVVFGEIEVPLQPGTALVHSGKSSILLKNVAEYPETHRLMRDCVITFQDTSRP